ncbi:hypothetical protein DFJ74DRAFT_703521 [Hyaloraphidium curvatum]|nr:hypothetical protein DFJ74DRAFT_703521 [Hyaloraphidium curvatum]
MQATRALSGVALRALPARVSITTALRLPVVPPSRFPSASRTEFGRHFAASPETPPPPKPEAQTPVDGQQVDPATSAPAARYPWRFSFEPPYPPPPSSFFARVVAPIKASHFLSLGLQRAKRHLPSHLRDAFPASLLENDAPALIRSLFGALTSPDATEEDFHRVACPLLADRLIEAASEAEQLGLDVQFAVPPGSPAPESLKVVGYRFLYGPRDPATGAIPETHTRTPWFNGLVTLIVPREEAEFRHHQHQRELVLGAMAEGGVIHVDVKASNWAVGMRVAEGGAPGSEGAVVVEDRKDGIVYTFESSRFVAGPKGQESKLLDDAWGWRISDIDFILTQEQKEM